MAIKISTLQTFAAVAETGSLALAADRLNRSASAISMTLKQLEEELGRPLFEADRKSRLTPLGHYVLEQATRELEQFEHTVQAIKSYARNEVGFLRIASVPSVARRILPGLLSEFLARRPKIDVDLRDMDSLSVYSALDAGLIELGIASPPNHAGSLQSRPMMGDPFGVVCTKDHPLAGLERSLRLEDLEPFPFIANGICRGIGDSKLDAILDASNMMVRNTTSILALVAAGVGITILPRLAVLGTLPEIRFLALHGERFTRQICVLQRADATLTPVAEAFAEVLCEKAGGLARQEEESIP